jgi:membrane protease YdiL (CAAX protease family)
MRFSEWRDLFVAHHGLRRSLLWGGAIGLGLALASLGGIGQMRAAAPPELQMAAMADILIGDKLILLFPLLILAEEFLWRGLLLSALLGSGWGSGAAIVLTTVCFTLNHFAVAPVGLMERAMMATMALPLGIVNAVLTVRTQNLWGGALIHLIAMLAMVVGIVWV